MVAHFPEPTDVESSDAQLSDLDREILEFEGDWVQYAGAKDAAVRDRFDLTPTGYHQRLNQLIDLPAAEAHAPRLVRRLRRRRATRQEQRSARRVGSANQDRL